MKTNHLVAAGALALAALVLAPAVLAAEATSESGKKRFFWNRLRDPKPAAQAAAETPAPTETAPSAEGVEVAVAVAKTVEEKEARRAEKEQEKLEQEAAVGTSGGRRIERVVARLRVGPIGRDAAAAPYLDLIGTGRATAAEMNDFAAYVARKGLLEEALEIQHKAIDLDPRSSTLWLNLGTLQRGVRRSGAAQAAYRRAIDLDPSNALAWYNLGVVQDTQGDYDDSVESFRRALTLDPTLADAKVNPQVVNNDRMLVVQLLLSQQKTGALGLPLVPMQLRPAPADAPAVK